MMEEFGCSTGGGRSAFGGISCCGEEKAVAWLFFCEYRTLSWDSF